MPKAIEVVCKTNAEPVIYSFAYFHWSRVKTSLLGTS